MKSALEIAREIVAGFENYSDQAKANIIAGRHDHLPAIVAAVKAIDAVKPNVSLQFRIRPQADFCHMAVDNQQNID